jgi:catechol 2,3-dioxygenase-like lactoylglutathione lyase family enzyme
MPFHHLAVVTSDSRANHLFYTRAMGFSLAKTEVNATPEGGWAKHLFYDVGDGEMIAFWELHSEEMGLAEGQSAGISTGMGLPEWVNHIAFHAKDLEDLDRRRERWVENGYSVLEIDHVWCKSIYTRDPNSNMVEWCTMTRELDPDDGREALELAKASQPTLAGPGPKPKLYEAESAPVHRRETGW